MNRSAGYFITLVLFCASCIAQPCVPSQISSAEEAKRVLVSLNPSETTAEAKSCIVTAIAVSAQLRDKNIIPDLVRYLSFRADSPPEEADGAFFRVRTEGDEYPAVRALALMGELGRPALLQVIEADNVSEIDRKNAAHALVLSFSQGKPETPGQSIRYIRSAEPKVDTTSKQRLEQAVEFILKTPACGRSSEDCLKAAQESSQ